MAKVTICDIDVCGKISCESTPQKADAQKVLQIIGASDLCQEHYDLAETKDWKEYLKKAFEGGGSGEDGSYDKPFFWQAGMDVKKGKYYHVYGSEYSAIKDMPNCQIQPTGDNVNWQWVRKYP